MNDRQPPIRKQYPFTVIGTETDILDHLTPQALFGFMQEAATLHCADLGMAEPVERAGGVWLLRRSRAVWHRMPTHRDKLHVETWSRGTSLVTFLRDFRFYLNDDFSHPVGVGSSEWIVASRTEHRPMRPLDLLTQDMIETLAVPETAIDKKSPRLGTVALPERPIKTLQIGYSELDHNRHVNNTNYLKYGIDAIAKWLSQQNRFPQTGLLIAAMDVMYLRELAYNDRLAVFIVEREDDFFIEGKKQDGETCFRMTLTVAEP